MLGSAPFCFVIMPFGRKKDPHGGAVIDFDAIYTKVLCPAITDAGLYPYRDDVLMRGGIVQKGIFEALLLCEYAIADLTIENGNVLYELGIRHAARPSSTLTLSARPESIPFDVANLRTIRYLLNKRNELGRGAADRLRQDIKRELSGLQQQVSQGPDFSDSPLFQLIEGWRPPPPESLKTDMFRDRMKYNDNIKGRLDHVRALGKRGGLARERAVEKLIALESELGEPSFVEAGVQVDVMLTHRALELWDGMISFIEKMPGFLRDRAMVQEQLVLALNRRAGGGDEDREEDRDRAVQILTSLVDQGRSSSETFGLIGRIHKDRWRESRSARPPESRRHLDNAIEAYSEGFHMDPRDPYPGLNAATLLLIKGDDQSRELLSRLVPVVEYAAHRLLEVQKPTYWMHATLLECAVLRNDERNAQLHLSHAERRIKESWEPETTVQNLLDLAEASPARGHDETWIRGLADQLESMRFA